MNIWGLILKWNGWKVSITAPVRKKCVICVAPHTSNWDFFWGLAAYKSLGREANFLMKEFWFFFPLKYLLRYLGGIPVPRRRHDSSLTQEMVSLFEKSDYVNLAVTPEGTRSRNKKWHTGFLYMSHQANVPIQLGIIDYSNKEIIIRDEYTPLGDIYADMEYVKAYYSSASPLAKYPKKFTL